MAGYETMQHAARRHGGRGFDRGIRETFEIMNCTHTNAETRTMSHCNQIKLQCLDCGLSVGSAIRHASIPPETLATISEFDYEFRDLMNRRRVDLFRQESESIQIEKEAAIQARTEKYHTYLKTPKWREKRSRVIDRENGICQGCRMNRIQEVHHLTYDNCGDELLFQLVGLCSDCHSKAHNK